MSSCGNPVAAGDEAAALMPSRTKFDKSVACIRCKILRGNLVIRHTVYCKECFFPLLTHKFRKTIEPHISPSASLSRDKSKIRASGNVLLGFSGGLGSSVALDVFRRVYFSQPGDDIDGGDLKAKERIEKKGTKAPKRKRCWEKAYVCYVEICGAYPDGQTDDRTELMQRHVNEAFKDATFISARLEDAFDEDWWSRVSGLREEGSSLTRIQLGDEGLPFITDQSSPSSSTAVADPKALLRSYLSSLPTSTAVQSTITTLTRLVLLYTAHHLRCSHLLLGTSLTSHSIGIINSIAQGGGAHVLQESYEEWTPPKRGSSELVDENQRGEADMGVRIVRPLKDIGMKECSAWAFWKGLRIPGKRPLPSGSSTANTIGGLTKNFIIGLEKDYPSTVSTIARTVAKLAPKSEVEGQCAICQRPKPVGVLDWKSRISVRTIPIANLSAELAAFPEPYTDLPKSRDILAGDLCYACHTTLTSRTPRSAAPPQEGVILPKWASTYLPSVSGICDDPNRGLVGDVEGELMVTRQMDRGAMKEAMGDFLLEHCSVPI